MDAAIREVKKHQTPFRFLFSVTRRRSTIPLELVLRRWRDQPSEHHLFIETMPFGGVGFSGIGHYYGKAGFDALTHAKSVLISPPTWH